jgi:hypothetical protein
MHIKCSLQVYCSEKRVIVSQPISQVSRQMERKGLDVGFRFGSQA